MTGYKFIFVITDREFGEDYENFLNRHDVTRFMQTLAYGTAEPDVLDSFGLRKTEKLILGFLADGEKAAEIKKALYTETNITSAGGGIAVFLSVDGLGESARKFFCGEEKSEKGERFTMETSDNKFVMLTVIADKGNSDTVMEAARGAGATGGTVVRAKGTGARIAKFFGVTISEEKEIIYIVAKRELRDGIMRAVMEKAGKNTGAHGVVFSLPLDAVAGINGAEA